MTELYSYTVTWRLPQYGFERAFTISGEFTSAEAAAEHMFLVANAGWEPSHEQHPRTMEDKLRRDFGVDL